MIAYHFFICNDTATTEIYTYGHTLSLHDALPISGAEARHRRPWTVAHAVHPGRVDARQRRPFFVEAQVRRGMAQRAPQLAAAHHASADRIRRTQQARRRVDVPDLKGREDAGAGHALAVAHHRHDGLGRKTVGTEEPWVRERRVR